MSTTSEIVGAAVAAMLVALLVLVIVVVILLGPLFWGWLVGAIASVFFGVVWPWWPHKLLLGFAITVALVVLGKW